MSEIQWKIDLTFIPDQWFDFSCIWIWDSIFTIKTILCLSVAVVGLSLAALTRVEF